MPTPAQELKRRNALNRERMRRWREVNRDKERANRKRIREAEVRLRETHRPEYDEIVASSRETHDYRYAAQHHGWAIGQLKRRYPDEWRDLLAALS